MAWQGLQRVRVMVAVGWARDSNVKHLRGLHCTNVIAGVWLIECHTAGQGRSIELRRSTGDSSCTMRLLSLLPGWNVVLCQICSHNLTQCREMYEEE